MNHNDVLGRFIIHNIRDKTINHIIRSIDNPLAADKKLADRLSRFPPSCRDALRQLAVYITDEAVFNTLVAMEEECGRLSLSLQNEDGSLTPLLDQADPLFNLYSGPDGWIETYSSHPASDFDQ